MGAVRAPAAENGAAQTVHDFGRLQDGGVVVRADRVGVGAHVFRVGGPIGEGVEHDDFTEAPTGCIAAALGDCRVVFELIGCAGVEQHKGDHRLVTVEHPRRAAQEIAVRTVGGPGGVLTGEQPIAGDGHGRLRWTGPERLRAGSGPTLRPRICRTSAARHRPDPARACAPWQSRFPHPCRTRRRPRTGSRRCA